METFVTLIGVTDIERCLELKLFNSIKRGGGGASIIDSRSLPPGMGY